MNLLMVIFGLIAIFAVVGTVQAFKERNALSILFNLGAAVVFGGFTIATTRFPRVSTNSYIKTIKTSFASISQRMFLFISFEEKLATVFLPPFPHLLGFPPHNPLDIFAPMANNEEPCYNVITTTS